VKTLILFHLVLPLSIHPLPGQEKSDCRVMVPALQGYYEGGCKNGFAQGKGTARGTDTYTGNFKNGYPQGKGTYTWASGDTHKGEWEKGKREGEGTFSGSLDGRDSVLTGIWKDDQYKGPKPQTPKIIQRTNIQSTTFTRIGDGNQIAITFYMNGMSNMVESLEIVTDSGTENQASNITYIRDIVFPFHCRVSYSYWNSMRTVYYDSKLEFEITQPGNWELKVGN
jgi:hypothetical protein